MLRFLFWVLMFSGVAHAEGFTHLPSVVLGSSCSASQFATQLTSAGSLSCAQPSFSNLSGVATIAQTVIATQPISASAINWSTGSVFTKSIGSTNTTFTFSNQASGQTIVTRVIATSGGVTWPSIKWSGGVAPTQTANGTDVCTFIYDGSNTYGNCIQDLR